MSDGRHGATLLGPRASVLLGLLAGFTGPKTTAEVVEIVEQADRSESFDEIRRTLPSEFAAAFFVVAELAREGRSAILLLLDRLESLGLVSRVTVKGEDLWAKK